MDTAKSLAHLWTLLKHGCVCVNGGELSEAAWEVTKADWSLGSTDMAKSSMCLCWTPRTWLLTCVHGLLDKKITWIFRKQHAHKMSVVKTIMLSWISENIRNLRFEMKKFS